MLWLHKQQMIVYTCTSTNNLFLFTEHIGPTSLLPSTASIINSHILECLSPSHTSIEFRIELATDLLVSHNSRKRIGRPSDGPPAARFIERYFPKRLNKCYQCRVCSVKGIRKQSQYTAVCLVLVMECHSVLIQYKNLAIFRLHF